MRESGSRGVALGLAVAVMLGAGGGLLLSRISAEASTDFTRVRPLTFAQDEAAEPSPVAERRARAPSRTACGPTDARSVRFRVSIHGDQPTTKARFARRVRAILCDERGWTASGVRFRYHPKGEYLVSLRSAAATERRCMDLVGLSVRHTWSCAGTREAVLNADRWFEGSPTLGMSVKRYRRLLVNHEVGHLLGHGHRGCSAAGAKAPVMMQQSKGLGGCRANVWPLPYEL